MANLNRVLLIGRLTRNPELKYTPSQVAICEFGLAVNRVRKGMDGAKQEETCFIECTAWRQTAELAGKYLTKGRQVFVEGYLKYDSWQTPEGQKRNKLTVTVDSIEFLDSRGDGEGGQPVDGAEGAGRGRQHGGGGGRRAMDDGDDFGAPAGGRVGSAEDDIPF
ncbi:MAG: single-stranded DNA-binding protein [Planctomycetia bacterium]